MSHRIFKSCEQPVVNKVDQIPENSDGFSITFGTLKEKKILSQHDKCRKAFEVTCTLASLASEASGELFQNWLATLHHILELWKNGKEVALNMKNYDERSGDDDDNLIANKEDEPILQKKVAREGIVPENHLSSQQKNPAQEEENSSLEDKPQHKKTYSKYIQPLMLLLSI